MYSYDAKLPLAQIRDIALASGLSFMLMSEHSDEMTPEAAARFFEECKALSDEKFIFIAGFEANYGGQHVLMFGSDAFVTQFANPDDLTAWKVHAKLVALAHPHRDGYRTDDALLPILDGVEIWNAQYDGKRVPRNGSRRLLARLQKERPMLAFAGWDFHRASHAGGPVYAVDAASLSEKEIIEAMKAGKYAIESSKVSIKSDGTILRAPVLMALQSTATTAFITFAKTITASLAALGFPIPKDLAARVRRHI
jgi:hypothetical protein